MRYAVPRAACALVLGGLILTACSSDPSTEAAAPAHNAYDIAFAEQMIPHHEQALTMADLAQDQSDDPGVLRSAAAIRSTQNGEIATLHRWLGEWGLSAGASAGASGGHDGGSGGHGGGSGESADDATDMPGMLSAIEMTELSNQQGANFDRAWLKLMIAHHKGAVTMAATEVDRGRSAEAVAMATEIIETQTREIRRFEQQLARR